MGYADFDKSGRLYIREADTTFFVSTIGTEKFMNQFKISEATKKFTASDKKEVKMWNPEGVKKYTLLKYSVTKDKLVIWEGDPTKKALATLIDNGKLDGSVKWDEKKESAAAELTASTVSLNKFLRGGGSTQIFPDSIRYNGNLYSCKKEYSRVNLPTK
jgi:hypothetical protein